MANTEITLANDGGAIVPTPSSVHVVHGDTVTFSAENGAPVVLFFSPGAASILSPAQHGPVSIAAHGKAVFTFSSSSPGAYSVFFGVDPKSPPSSFPQKISGELLLEISSLGAAPPPFSGPNDTTSGGSLV
jgi:plastocyanin